MEDFFNIDLSQLSIFNFFGLAIFGVFVFVFLWFFKNYLILILVKSPVQRRKIIELLPAINTLIWILFVLYALYVFIKPFPFFGIVLTLIFIYLGRGYLVNLVHGLFFRLKRDIVLGQKIAFDEYNGIVEQMNVFDLEIENDKGELIQIPYGNMANKEITKKDFSSDLSSFKFSLNVPFAVSETQLKQKLLSSPWISTVFEPKITKVSNNNEYNSYNVIVYALADKFHSNIEKKIKNEILESN